MHAYIHLFQQIFIECLFCATLRWGDLSGNNRRLLLLWSLILIEFGVGVKKLINQYITGAEEALQVWAVQGGAPRVGPTSSAGRRDWKMRMGRQRRLWVPPGLHLWLHFCPILASCTWTPSESVCLGQRGLEHTLEQDTESLLQRTQPPKTESWEPDACWSQARALKARAGARQR